MDRNTDIVSDDDEIWFGETCVIGQQQVGWAQAAGNALRVAAQITQKRHLKRRFPAGSHSKAIQSPIYAKAD